MAKKNILILYLTAWSVVIVYGGILFLNYEQLNQIVPTHINYQGTVDGYNDKFHLWIAIGVNAILLLGIKWAISKPHALNYPVEITDDNRERMYYTVQLFLSYLAIVTSVLFSFMIFNALHYNVSTVACILLAIVVPPIVFVTVFNKVKK